MTIEKACEITGIRINELSRINSVVLKEIIEQEKNNRESDYLLKPYTKHQYVEAYETLLTTTKEDK